MEQSLTTKSNAVSAQPDMTRGQKLWQRIRDRRDKEPASMERARLLTASFKETEGLPTPIRRAKAFEKIVTEIPIYIDDDQLLVGDFGSRPMAAEWLPEYYVDWVIPDLKSEQFLQRVRKKDVKTMKEIHDYWKDRAFKPALMRYLGDEKTKELYEMCDRGAWVYSFFQELEGDKSWYSPDFEKAIQKGLSGILSEVEEELRATRIWDEVSRDKRYFLQAMAIALRAGIQYGRRYASLARELTALAEGNRKAELQRIADICEWVPEKPARNFHEALQTMWFCQVLMYFDAGAGADATAPGRVDQYFYPYYKSDIEEGRLTREEAIQLLECLRVKMSAGRRFRAASSHKVMSGEAMFLNCTLGGQTPDGEDATNELSYLWIEAAMRTRTPHPTLSVRYHENLSPIFAMKAAELTRLGLGYPAWFGDKTYIEYWLRRGVTLEEARGYTLAGCVLPVMPHQTAATMPIIMNMPKILELTLSNGVDPATNKQFGPKTGKFEDFNTYEELYRSFQEQVNLLVGRSTKGLNEARLFRSAILPQVFASCLFDDCIKRGQSTIGGGSRYQQGSMYVLPVGLIDVADSLAAIKKCVYEEAIISKQQLMEGLGVNFEGKEDLHRLLRAAPKYGNGNEYVDSIVADLYDWLTRMTNGMDACYGATYECAPHSISFQGPCGSHVGALPSGRQAGRAVADGGVSPSQGMDVSGPTAVIKSASRINQVAIFGTLFNMKFSPSALKTKEDLFKFLSLIKTYLVDLGGEHIQFNVVDRKTLLDAQKHPDRYRNLLVRVAGYSALWVELDPQIQAEIIARSENEL
jgi:pyruvate formate-lyase/glycerol dehydratase family glycyl radical enzyme